MSGRDISISLYSWKKAKGYAVTKILKILPGIFREISNVTGRRDLDTKSCLPFFMSKIPNGFWRWIPVQNQNRLEEKIPRRAEGSLSPGGLFFVPSI